MKSNFLNIPKILKATTISAILFTLPSYAAIKRCMKSPVFFENNSAQLNSEAKENLSGFVKKIFEGEEVPKIEVQGHASPKGSPARNAKLAKLRARAVKKELSSLGIPSQRISAISLKTRIPPRGRYPSSVEKHNKWRRAELVCIK